jgi:Negative regulator of sigma F
VIARGPISKALLVALPLLGVAGLGLGLSSRIPGRERLALAAAASAALGALGVAAIALSIPAPILDARTIAQSIECTVRALLLAIPSGLFAVRLTMRGAPWHSGAAGLGVWLGAVSLGALLVHASCPSPEASHWVTAHALLPLAGSAVLGLLFAWHLERLARRSRQGLAHGLEA